MHTLTPTFSQRKIPSAAATALAILLLSGCAPSPSATGGTTHESSAVAGAASEPLSEEAREACASIFNRTVESSPSHIALVVDSTASNTTSGLSTELADTITTASKEGGSITVIAVDGEGATPTMIVKNAALSDEGTRDRPSVDQIAAFMPACVEQTLLPQAVPTTPGTDLHRAMALASEVVTPETQVVLVSDMISTSGPFALTPTSLTWDATELASSTASTAPIDLGGVPLTIEGVGNTSTPLLTANRDWLRDLAVGLCSEWNATGCDDITTSPVNPTPGGEGLPEDPIPAFPEVTATASGTSCLYEAPANLTFAGESEILAEGAAELFSGVIDTLIGTPAATATIIGHTASSHEPSLRDPIELSTARGNAVATLLTSNGVAASQIVAVRGVGDTQPKIEDIDPATGLQIEAAAALERRVDVIVEGAPCQA